MATPPNSTQSSDNHITLQRPYLPSMASHLLRPVMLVKTAGETWLHTYEGELWPVVLCDDDIPPQNFMDSKPRGGHVHPAILLGRLKYIWVADNRLVEFDPNHSYVPRRTPSQSTTTTSSDSKSEKSEKLRYKAFVEDALQFETPEFWKNYIEQRSQARTVKRELTEKYERSIESTKRSQRWETYLGKAKRQRRSDQCDAILPSPPITQDQNHLASGAIAKDAASDDESLFVSQTSLSDPFVYHAEDGTQIEDGTHTESGTPMEDQQEEITLQEQRKKNLEWIRSNPPSEQKCLIFAGAEYTTFSISKEALAQCDYLVDRLDFSKDFGSYINLTNDNNISTEGVRSIATYLTLGDFKPYSVVYGGKQRLEGIVLEQEKEEATISIAKLFLTASAMQFDSLHLRCLNKLDILQPFSTNNLLTVVMLLSRRTRNESDLDGHVRDWLVNLIAEQFWALVANENITLGRVVGQNEELRRAVLEKLGKNPDMGLTGMDAD